MHSLKKDLFQRVTSLILCKEIVENTDLYTQYFGLNKRGLLAITMILSNISKGILLPLSQKALKELINNAIENPQNNNAWLPLIKYSTGIAFLHAVNTISCLALRTSLRHIIREDLAKDWIGKNTFYGIRHTESGKQIKNPEDIIRTPYEFCLNLINLINDRLTTLSYFIGALYSLYLASEWLEISLGIVNIEIPYLITICFTYACLYNSLTSWTNTIVKNYITNSKKAYDNLNKLTQDTHTNNQAIAFLDGGNIQRDRFYEINYQGYQVLENSQTAQFAIDFFNKIHWQLSPIIGIIAQLWKETVNAADILNCGTNFALIIKCICWRKDNLSSIKNLEINANKLKLLQKTIKEFKELKKNCKIKYFYNQNQFSIDLTLTTRNKTNEYSIKTKLKPGKKYRIIGKNGAGKTTLLEILRQNMTPTLGSGEIRLPEKNKIYFIPQTPYIQSKEYSLLNTISFPNKVETNKRTIAFIKRLMSKFEALRDIANEIEETGGKNWNENLSLGQKRLITIISAIIKKPKLLIADEPFESLDLPSYEIAISLINKHLKDTTILYVHHKLDNSQKKDNIETNDLQPIKIIEADF